MLAIFGLLTGLVLTIAVIAVPFIGINYPTGSGTQVGYVSAIEKTGIIWKTGRAYIKSDLSSTQEDLYCVMDDKVYDSLREASLTKTRVELSHNSVLVAGITDCEGESAIIQDVAPAN